MKRTFFVVAKWDPDAHVYFSQSDIQGLHIEAGTWEEFESLVAELAPELIIENHLGADDLATTPLKQLIPSIVLREPTRIDASA